MRSASLILSLTLCAAAIFFWIRSYQAPWSTDIVLAGQLGPKGGVEDGTEWIWTISSAEGIYEIRPRYSFYSWPTPYWKLIVLTLVIPEKCLRRRVRAVMAQRRIARRGLCPTCNFDLRATPHRCPECGVSPSRTSV
jgi:hypothetical protein